MHPEIEIQGHYGKAYYTGDGAIRKYLSELAAEHGKRRQCPERLYQVCCKVADGECIYNIRGAYAKLLCGGHNIGCLHHKLRAAGGHDHIK